ncbi:MAG: TldD/PmbA family protein [Candidatus Bathyarchaeota archaeon]|nr:TldD/PmbA family protein [Candidatus Bathyarchaeota archaeon]MDW8040733.1 TldD/PmbA family protein [Nitrososphaerota archaeon]
MNFLDFANLAVKTCQKLGADEAEAFVQNEQIVEVVLERAEIQNERFKTHSGIGIRVIKDKKLGFAFASKLSKENVEKACKAAVSLAKVSLPNPEWVSLPVKERLPQTPEGIFDPEIANISGDKMLNFVIRAYNEAKGYDKRVEIDDGKFSAVLNEIAILNSRGVEAQGKTTRIEGYLVCVAKEHGEASSMAYEYDVSTMLNDFFPEKIGRTAAEKALLSLYTKKVEPFTGMVILDSDPAASILLNPVISSVNADNVQRGRSLWSGKIGEKVAAAKLTILDDGLMAKGIGSQSFDFEGAPRQKTPTITRGKLVGFIHNSYTANKEGKKSTGNAYRGSYTTPPTIAASNFVVKAGKKKLEELIAEVEKGIIVRRFSGNVRLESGEFSGIAKQASYIENGEIKYALKETMISGNAFQALNDIVEIGCEIRPTGIRAYTPPILVDNIQIISKQ